MAPDDERVVKPTNQARQAVSGHQVRWVLIVSLAAVVAAFAGLWVSWFG